MSEWISVLDKKPDNMQKVICIRSKNFDIQRAIDVCIYDKEEDLFIDVGGWDFPAKYWMPLPKPPK